MRYFKTSESFFSPNKKKKKTYMIKNPIDKELKDQEEAQILDEISIRASHAHGTNTELSTLTP